MLGTWPCTRCSVAPPVYWNDDWWWRLHVIWNQIQKAQLRRFPCSPVVYAANTRHSRSLYPSDQFCVCLSKTDNKNQANIAVWQQSIVFCILTTHLHSSFRVQYHMRLYLVEAGRNNLKGPLLSWVQLLVQCRYGWVQSTYILYVFAKHYSAKIDLQPFCFILS